MANNLESPIQRVLLYDTITTADVGVYGDTKKVKNILAFKKEGIQIPGAANTAGAVPVAASGTRATNLIKITRSETNSGILNGGLISLKTTAPCSDCDYNYGISFTKEVQYPGQNNFETNTVKRYYAGTIARPSVSAGVIQDSTLLAMEDELIRQITADRGVKSTLTDVNDQSFVEARRFYIIDETSGTGSSDITITWPDGTTTPITALNTSAAGKIAYDFNALTTVAYGSTLNALLRMYRIGTNKYMITSINAGLLFTVTLVANLTFGTSGSTSSRGIYYKSIDKLVQAKPYFNETFANHELITIASITATTGTHTFSGIANGVSFSYSSAGSATSTTNFANINTANTLAYRYFAGQLLTGSSQQNSIVAIGINSFKFKTTGTAVATWTVNGLGIYPYLTGDDVFRIFSFQKNVSFPNIERLSQPSAASTWYKYIITYRSDAQPLGGVAGQIGYTDQTVEIYCTQANAVIGLYDASDVSGVSGYTTTKNWAYNGYLSGTADLDIETLLEIYSGLAIANWD